MKTPPDGFHEALDTSLEQVLRYGASLEVCLRLYPQHAAELEPLLRTALETQRALDFTPSAEGKARARLALEMAMNRHRSRRTWSFLAAMPAQIIFRYRWATASFAAASLVLLGGAGMVAASSSSMPEEALYPVKRASEQVRAFVTFDTQAKARLYADYADRRTEEMTTMAARGKIMPMANLAKEIESHLQEIQRNAMPDVTPSAVEWTPLSTSDLREVARQKPELSQRSLAEKRQLQLLRKRLERALEREGTLFEKAMTEAPEPSRDELKKEHEVIQWRYGQLIQVVRGLEDDD